MEKRDNCFIFADVHGEAKKLEKLIKFAKEQFGEDVELYSLGDLIDRRIGNSNAILPQHPRECTSWAASATGTTPASPERQRPASPAGSRTGWCCGVPLGMPGSW